LLASGKLFLARHELGFTVSQRLFANVGPPLPGTDRNLA
jgi:hypothetical protein